MKVSDDKALKLQLVSEAFCRKFGTDRFESPKWVEQIEEVLAPLSHDALLRVRYILDGPNERPNPQ